MAKVHVFVKDLRPAEVQELILLLEAAGVPASEIVLVEELPAVTDDCLGDIFVFLLTPPPIASEAAMAAISGVPNGGRQAICVWPQGAAADAPIPPAAAKFAYSTVAWDPEHLRGVLEGDTTSFEKPTGERVAPPETDRNECD